MDNITLNPPNTTILLIKMFLSLGFILAILLFIMYALKFINKKFQPIKGNLINIISTTYLHPKKQLHLIKVNNSYLLLGSTDHSITLLHKFEEHEFEKILNEKLKNEG